MNIQPAHLGNAKTLSSLRSNMLAAREAVARREEPGQPFDGYHVMRATDTMTERLEAYGPQFGWTPETSVADAARDLRSSRKADLMETGWRLGATLLMAGGFGLAAELLKSSGIALTPVVEFAAVAVTTAGAATLVRPEKMFAAYLRTVDKGPLANTMERWT